MVNLSQHYCRSYFTLLLSRFIVSSLFSFGTIAYVGYSAMLSAKNMTILWCVALPVFISSHFLSLIIRSKDIKRLFADISFANLDISLLSRWFYQELKIAVLAIFPISIFLVMQKFPWSGILLFLSIGMIGQYGSGILNYYIARQGFNICQNKDGPCYYQFYERFFFLILLTRVFPTFIFGLLTIYYIYLNANLSSELLIQFRIIVHIMLGVTVVYSALWHRARIKNMRDYFRLLDSGTTPSLHVVRRAMVESLEFPVKGLVREVIAAASSVVAPIVLYLWIFFDAPTKSLIHVAIGGSLGIAATVWFNYYLFEEGLFPIQKFLSEQVKIDPQKRPPSRRLGIFAKLLVPTLTILLILALMIGAYVYRTIEHEITAANIALTEMSIHILVMTVCAFVVATLLTTMMARSLARRFQLMKETMETVKSGNFSVRNIALANDEIGDLETSMNFTIDELSSNKKEIDALTYGLEKKVEERTAELKKANEQLQELDKAKSRFFSNLTHEFRTPLVSLDTTLQLLRERAHDPDIEKLLSTSQASLDDMLENVNDLLNKTRSEKGLLEMKWSQVEIVDFLEKAVGSFEPLAQKQHDRLVFINKIPQPPLPKGEKNTMDQRNLTIYADRSKLKKILNNLIGNAIKFTKNGEIEVSLSQSESECIIQVRDTGPGIPKDELPTIFDPFTQASNNTLREVQGTGLGLAMVKDFVEQHKGSVTVESEVGKGSVFTVHLPLGDAHVDKTKLSTVDFLEVDEEGPINLGVTSFDDLDAVLFSSNDPSRLTLLLVEDNPQVLQALAYVLSKEYNLRFAKDGEEGLEKAQQLKPDLIVSDIMMPKKNGYELVQAIKRDPELKMIPVILLTSKADVDSKIKGIEGGADEYLTKPFNNREVLTRVKGLLERRKIETEFIHAEKMIALGRLVAGISHEINNPISYARNAAINVREFFEAMETNRLSVEEGMHHIKEAIASVEEGTQRVCDITAALRGFIRQGAKGFQAQDLHKGLDATILILEAGQHAALHIHKHYEFSEAVVCNLNQLNQVFLNILLNAMQSFDHQNEGNVWIRTYRENDQACISIRDDGPGIPEAFIPKLFDPFFTTKDIGSGMGLGLYISHQIVAEHGGSLSVTSTPGQGTEFIIRLPIQGIGDRYDNPRYTTAAIDRDMADIHYPHR